MICNKCNNEIPDGAKFCTNCGNAIGSFGAPNNAVNLAKSNENTMPAAFTEVNNTASVPTPSAPSFTPTSNPVGYYPNGDFGAAVVVAPAAKKKNGKKIALILGIIFAVLIAAGAVLFFTNKALVMSLVMGKPRYAAMIERDSVTKFTNSIDTDALSKQIKSLSQVMTANSLKDSLTLSDKSGKAVYLMQSGVGSMLPDGMDIKSVIKSANESMQSLYGCNRMSGSFKLTGNLDIDDYEISEIFDAINGSEITYDFAATDTMFGGELGIVYNGNPLNLKFILDDNGTMYLSLPFVSDTAFKISAEALGLDFEGSSETVMPTATLDLDSGELKRLINEMVSIYTKYIEKSTVTMESGSMSIAGKVIEGKKLVADINGINLENLIKEMFEHFANDSYMCRKVVEYVNSFDATFTEAEYKNLITSAVSKIQGISSSEKFVITTIINNNGDTLAKSYAFVMKGMTVPEIAWAANDTESVFDVKALGQQVLSCNLTKTSKTDGSGKISIATNIGNNISVLFNYSGADTADFGNSKVGVGKFQITLDTSNAGSYFEDYDFLNGLSVSSESSVENGTYKQNLKLYVKGIMDIDFTSDMTLSNDVSNYNIPSDVIDISSAIINGDADDNTKQRIMDYMEALMEKLEGIIPDEMIEDMIGEALAG